MIPFIKKITFPFLLLASAHSLYTVEKKIDGDCVTYEQRENNLFHIAQYNSSTKHYGFTTWLITRQGPWIEIKKMCFSQTQCQNSFKDLEQKYQAEQTAQIFAKISIK